MKVALAFLAAMALTSATKAPERLGPTDLYPQVRQVACAGSLRTAFRIKGGKLVSVNHVTRAQACSIDGLPIGRVDADPDLDFSVIEAAGQNGFPISCEGYKPGQWYFAIGFAKGYRWQTMLMVLATFQKSANGQQILIGVPTFIPGMSGGPVLNAKGEVVGTVNAYNSIFGLSFSRPLSDTALCKAKVTFA